MTIQLALVAGFAAISAAQVGPFPTSFSLAPVSQQFIQVPQGASATGINITVDPGPAGADTLDILVGDPSVVVSLMLPDGTQITSANAPASGFTWSNYSSLGLGTADLFSPFDLEGNHTVIQLPSPAIPGVYTISANSTAAQSATYLIVNYYSSSTVQVAAGTDAGSYRSGDTVILSGYVFDGQTPIQNATVTATAGTLLPVKGTIAGYQMVSSTQLDVNFTLYNYTVQLTNSGAAAGAVGATVSSAKTDIVADTVEFGNVAPGATVTSTNTFSFLLPNGAAFDPTLFTWKVQSPNTPINVTLLDSGTYDNASGDGIYTVAFAPTDPGSYSILLTASGVSKSGLPFSRTASATFSVNPPSAQFVAFSDAPVLDSASGLLKAVKIIAAVNVQQAGTYEFSVEIVAVNGKSTNAGILTQLTIGSGQLVAQFPASLLLPLGVNGPYTISRAQLLYHGPEGQSLADYRDPAGTTQPYSITSLYRGQIYFTGQIIATGVVTGPGPTFDLMQVQLGVQSLINSEACNWNGVLSDASGKFIDAENGYGAVPAGASLLTLSFNGNLIAVSGPGPYSVSDVSISCGTNRATHNGMRLSVSNFSPSQFTYVKPTFSLALTGPPLSGVAGTSISSLLTLSSSASFRGPVSSFATSGLPAGVSAAFGTPGLAQTGLNKLTITTPPSLSPGVYPFNITYVDVIGKASQTLPLTLTITGPASVAAPAFNPPAGSYSLTQAVTISTATSGAAIRYTIDGSTPSETAGTLYSGPVTVASTKTVNAIAYAPGLSTSPVASATFTFPITVTLTPALAALYANQTQQFTAAVTNTATTGVGWTISPSVGAISTSGIYTAPTSISSTQSVVVMATSNADTTKSATATVTLIPPVTLTVAPTAVNLVANGTQQFTATVANTSNTAITWTLSPNVGTISTSGLYTAPSSVSSQQTITVKATSAADTTKSATATVALYPPIANLSLTPSSQNLFALGTQQFTALSGGIATRDVTWSVNPNVGTVSTSGLYTAPAAIPNQTTVTVTATSTINSTKSGSASVNLGPLTMSISPSSANLSSGQSQGFSVQINRNPNTSVTWSINPAVGSIGANGVYTAPSRVTVQQTVTVTANSVADPTKSISSTVSLRP